MGKQGGIENRVFPVLGTAGSLLFAFCLAPVVYDVMTTHDATHVSWGFTLMSLAANLLTGSYVLYRDMMVDNTRHVPLYINYSVATFFCLLLLFYKFLFG